MKGIKLYMKNTSITKKLLISLYNDQDYVSYCEEYKKNNTINLILLKTLIKKYSKLLEIFYKINIFLYKYEIKINFNSDIDNKIFYLEDISIIFIHYKNNYLRCKNVINIIIQNKLVNRNECKLLELIIKRKYEDEIL